MCVYLRLITTFYLNTAPKWRENSNWSSMQSKLQLKCAFCKGFHIVLVRYIEFWWISKILCNKGGNHNEQIIRDCSYMYSSSSLPTLSLNARGCHTTELWIYFRANLNDVGCALIWNPHLSRTTSWGISMKCLHCFSINSIGWFWIVLVSCNYTAHEIRPYLGLFPECKSSSFKIGYIKCYWCSCKVCIYITYFGSNVRVIVFRTTLVLNCQH